MALDDRRFKNGKSARGRVRCTATSRCTGVQCNNSALPGRDKCKIHGGGTNVKHGRYSKYLKSTLKTAIADAQQGSAKDLNEELAVIRALLGRSLQTLEKYMVAVDEGDPNCRAGEMTLIGIVQTLVRDVRSLAESITRIEQQDAITPAQVEFVLVNILNILDQNLEKDTLMAVATQLQDIPWPSGVEITHSQNKGRPSNGNGNGQRLLVGSA